MRKNKAEAALFARYISEFLYDYAPCFLTHSDHTIKSYRDTINLYVAFLEGEGITPSSFGRKAFEKPLIEKWIQWLISERHSCPDTCNVRLGSLRVFLEYIGSKDICLLYLYHEAKTIKRQKCQKKKVKGLTRDAVSSIFDAIDTTSMIGRRDMALLSLLYGTAARIGEIQALTMKDLHLNSVKPYILLHGKGGKIRTAYLLPRMTANLHGYIAEFHGNHANPDSHLFYTRVGGRKENKLTEAAINKRIEKYAFLAHEKNPDVPLDTRPDLPKIGEGFMRPQFLSERLFVQFRYTYSVLSAGSFLAVISMAIFARYRLVPTPPVAVIPVSRSTSRIMVVTSWRAVIPYKFKYGVKSMKLSSME